MAQSNSIFIVQRVSPWLLKICIVLVIASCDNKNDDIIQTPEEDRILELAYDQSYTYPEGFYREPVDEGSVYYDNTLSIKPISEREHIWIELNTNDRNEARMWSDKSNDYNSVDREVVLENENEKYFQFKRVSSADTRDIIYSRVHKTSYFQPSLNKFSVSDSIIGKYNGELNSDNIRELVEYLWSCGTMDTQFTKVIKSEMQEYSDRFESYIQSIMIVYGDFGLHDEINVYDNHIKLNKTDRRLIINTQKTSTITGLLR